MREVAVACDPPDDPALRKTAASLAASLKLPAIFQTSKLPALVLMCTHERLELRWTAGEIGPGQRPGPVFVDLTAIDGKSSPGRSLKQPIAKAVGLKKGVPARPDVIDATAGFGEDAWLLACLGCNVTMIERSSVMSALLRDGLSRAQLLEPEIAGRLSLVESDACARLGDMRAAVVYVDPMYPHTGSSARQRKEMWLLRELVGDDDDSETLLSAARKSASKRVVVKQPLQAPPLAPDTVAVHKARAHRYDIYRPSAACQ